MAERYIPQSERGMDQSHEEMAYKRHHFKKRLLSEYTKKLNESKCRMTFEKNDWPMHYRDNYFHHYRFNRSFKDFKTKKSIIDIVDVTAPLLGRDDIDTISNSYSIAEIQQRKLDHFKQQYNNDIPVDWAVDKMQSVFHGVENTEIQSTDDLITDSAIDTEILSTVINGVTAENPNNFSGRDM